MTKRILIVDDETDFSELLQFRLRHLNYEVLAAASGSEALNKARSELPDVILLDLLLPDFDGLTLCEILRRRSPTREIPIILITAVTSEATQWAAKIAGASGFLGKPLDFDRLKEQIETVCTAGLPEEAAEA
jgi:DNA-binding response OmpR family regulator